MNEKEKQETHGETRWINWKTNQGHVEESWGRKREAKAHGLASDLTIIAVSSFLLSQAIFQGRGARLLLVVRKNSRTTFSFPFRCCGALVKLLDYVGRRKRKRKERKIHIHIGRESWCGLTQICFRRPDKTRFEPVSSFSLFFTCFLLSSGTVNDDRWREILYNYWLKEDT